MKIFISSVQKEFAAESKALAKMIREDRWLGGFFDVFIFEECSAKAKTAQKVYLDACHRDYASNACVQVMLFRDRLEVINPGCLPKGTTVQDLLISHDSNPRNHVIARAMSWTNYVEKSGSGTGEIIRLCREAGLADPVFESMTGHFKTTIWRRGYGPGLVEGASQGPGQGSGARVQCEGPSQGLVEGPSRGLVKGPGQILALLAEHAELPISRIAQALGKKSASGSMKRCLKAMIEDGLVSTTRPQKRGSRLQRYRLTAKGRSLAGQLSQKKGGTK